MTSNDMFISTVRSAGDLGAFFECDGDTAYLYLHDQRRPDGKKILGSIHIFTGTPDFAESDLELRWSGNEEVVGLFIHDALWAAFVGEQGFGGHYQPNGRPEMPSSIVAALSRPH